MYVRPFSSIYLFIWLFIHSIYYFFIHLFIYFIFLQSLVPPDAQNTKTPLFKLNCHTQNIIITEGCDKTKGSSPNLTSNNEQILTNQSDSIPLIISGGIEVN